MHDILRHHRLKLAILVLAVNAGLLIYLAMGRIATASEVHWMDIIGEGGSAAFVLAWLLMLLKSRPRGRVTNWLFLGMGFMFFSMWLDVLDEVIKIDAESVWDNLLESTPMPLGLVMLTIGLYHWHLEQQAINRQMEKRERLFREHLLFDPVTPLGGAEYLRRQVQLALDAARRERQPLSLIAVDVDDFSRVNQQCGMREGDRVLQALTQLLLLNLRHQDLLCRLAGDRFVALLPNTGEHLARQIATELQTVIAAFAHKRQPQGETLKLSACAVAVMALDETADALLERMNLALARAKQRVAQRWVRSA